MESLPEVAYDSISCFEGGQVLRSNNDKLVVRTLTSTDEGVAFIIEYEDKVLFHAGDLFLPALLSKSFGKIPGSPIPLNINIGANPEIDARKKKYRQEFLDYTEPLRGMKIDYGMIPLDPNFDDLAYDTISRYLDIADFKCWSPMHLWGDYDFVDRFLSEYPEFASRIIATTHNNYAKQIIEVNKRFILFELDNDSNDSIKDSLHIGDERTSDDISNGYGAEFVISSTVAIEGIFNYAKTVVAKPGDIIDFHLFYINTSDRKQPQVRLFDKFPEGIEYIQGSTVISKETFASWSVTSDDLFLDNGMNIGDFNPDERCLLTYRAKVTDDDRIFPKGETIIFNDARIALSDGTMFNRSAVITVIR